MQEIKKLFKFTYENIAVSEFLAENMRKQTPKKIEVIGNFLPNEWFSFSVNPEPATEYRFLHISGMDQNKNPQGILDACKILKERGILNWHFTFVSESDTSSFQDWTKVNGLEQNISFQKHVPHQEMPQLFADHDCFVLNSAQETFSIVNAEALCFGLHLITTPVGFLYKDKTEYMDKVPFNSPEELANKMMDSIKKRKSSGKRGRVFVEQFKEDLILDQYEKVYQKVLK